MHVSMCKKLLAYHLGYFVCLYICDLAAARRGGAGACALAAIVATVVLAFLYRFLEVHVSGDILRSFHGGRVGLSFHPGSEIYHRVASVQVPLPPRQVWQGQAPLFSGSTNVRRVWSIVMKFMSWGSELRDTLIAFYDVSL